MNTAVTVTIAFFMAGVIFQAGRFSARLEKLEEWRRDMMRALGEIHATLRRLEQHLEDGER